MTATEGSTRKTKKRAEHEPRIGAHVSGGLKGAVKKALEIGAESMQIFIGSPQTWKEPSPHTDDIAQFKKDVAEHNLGPVFVHGNYLVNLAATNLEFIKKSVLNLYTALRVADKVGAQGLIFHPGSAGQTSYEDALKRVLKSLEVVLDDYDGECKLLLEICAGQGQTIGDKFSEMRDIISAMGHDKRLGVAWDTCHLLNAGYDVATRKGLDKTVEEFEKEVGFARLYAVHANDSKHPLGAKRDRHENIGMGHIGEDAFRRMLNHEALRGLPWILEVPGFDDKGPDRKNIQILRRLAGLR